MIRLGDRVRYQGSEWDVWDQAPLRRGDPQGRWWLVGDDGTTRVDAAESEIAPLVDQDDLFGSTP